MKRRNDFMNKINNYFGSRQVRNPSTPYPPPFTFSTQSPQKIPNQSLQHGVKVAIVLYYAKTNSILVGKDSSNQSSLIQCIIPPGSSRTLNIKKEILNETGLDFKRFQTIPEINMKELTSIAMHPELSRVCRGLSSNTNVFFYVIKEGNLDKTLDSILRHKRRYPGNLSNFEMIPLDSINIQDFNKLSKDTINIFKCAIETRTYNYILNPQKVTNEHKQRLRTARNLALEEREKRKKSRNENRNNYSHRQTKRFRTSPF